MKVAICSWSTYKTGAVLLTKARWKRFIKWPLRGQGSSTLVPLSWKGLWLFLHPPGFCSLSLPAPYLMWLNKTEAVWMELEAGWASRSSTSFYLICKYHHLPIFSAWKTSASGQRTVSQSLSGQRKSVEEFLPWKSYLLHNSIWLKIIM